jgi:plastocyanin
MTKPALGALLIVANSLAATAYAETLIEQRDKKFFKDGKEVTTLTVDRGEVVSFLNNDPYLHTIYSASEPNDFDLGSYPKGIAESYTFGHNGVALIECAIHPQMKLEVTVK